MNSNAKTYSQERLTQVLLAPVVSEKSTFVGEKNNQFVFRVVPNATKPEIKAAVELLFSPKDKKLEVEGVRIVKESHFASDSRRETEIFKQMKRKLTLQDAF